ncbi:Protein phosphatase 1 regulatory subunit 3D [Acipenser ruthenus]|uniref:Protein phosphatase 1 regulatory subunit 3D n=1 Tax=Acipenser ruthenus TaxID=7906 RepID=A0A444U7J7_ACIRT|nr:Protein phosphatase 1 regulatory subunit 3D [Acipenser ruthenus]
MEKAAAQSSITMPHPRNCIPRNYSCIAALFGSVSIADQSKEDSVKDGSVECTENHVVQERPRGRETVYKPTLRKRAKSLPAPLEHTKPEIKVTPSPARQKKVRFADSLGLELISVKHFCNADVPEVPIHVMARLEQQKPPNHLWNVDVRRTPTQSNFLETQFVNPLQAPGFLERVQQMKVSLETVGTDDFSINGVIRVLNISFEKKVFVRYTLDNWLSFMDVPASYIYNSSNGTTDRFSFKLITPTFQESGGTLQFAIKYCVGVEEYWDNNKGNNYKIKSHRMKVSPPKEWENAWIHFI